MTVTLGLAGPGDDRDLLRLVADTGMEDSGPFQLGYGREPSFFHALDVEGSFRQVGVARDGAGALVGCFTRATRLAFVNGVERELGYIGAVRLRREHRGGIQVARGYRWLRELHGDGRSPFYLTTILEGNRPAIDLLTSGRAGLPRYHPLGRYHCLSILLGRPLSAPPFDGTVASGLPEDLPEIVACLRRANERRQFAPAWHEEDFAPGNPLTRGFSAEDFVVARRGGLVVGVLGAWDQRSFRQVNVLRYGLLMRLVRALWNGVMPRCGYSPLPPAGGELAMAYAAFPAVDGDEGAVFQALLAALAARGARRGFACCVVGLHERDPLLPAARRFLHLGYQSRVYGVYWEDGREAFAALDDRVPYLEAGTL